MQRICPTLLPVITILACSLSALAQDPLPSWQATAARQAIVSFVERVTAADSPDFVPVAERIATFDNDGCLWSEQPVYFQFFFVIDRIKAMAPQHPEWQQKDPFASLLKGDLKTALAGGEHAIIEAGIATHSGMTTEEFQVLARQWLATAKHPKTGLLFTEMIYQPMFEVLTYLRANGFKTFIVSGGGVEFLRAFAERCYGVPPEQVIGTTGKVMFEMRDGSAVLVKTPGIEFVDDKQGKPIAIHRIIGRRPIASFGNSDGDLPMMQWTAAGEGARFCLYVHHDDAEREWAYDRKSSVGRLDKGLDEAKANGWTVVSMKDDWKRIYP